MFSCEEIIMSLYIYEEKALENYKLDLIFTSGSATKEYDTTALKNNEVVVTSTLTDLVTNSVIETTKYVLDYTVNITGSQTVIGSSPNTFEIQFNTISLIQEDQTNRDITPLISDLNIDKVEGLLTVEPLHTYTVTFTATSGSTSRAFNGSTLSNHNVTISNVKVIDDITLTNQANCSITGSYSGWQSRIYAGTTNNTFTMSNIKVFKSGTDITSKCSTITPSYIYGKLTVTGGPTESKILCIDNWTITPANRWTQYPEKEHGYATDGLGSLSPGTMNCNGNNVTIKSNHSYFSFTYNDGSSGFYSFYGEGLSSTVSSFMNKVSYIVVYNADYTAKTILNYSVYVGAHYTFQSTHNASDPLGFFNGTSARQIHVVYIGK